jgi:hypothetical protein
MPSFVSTGISPVGTTIFLVYIHHSRHTQHLYAMPFGTLRIAKPLGILKDDRDTNNKHNNRTDFSCFNGLWTRTNNLKDYGGPRKNALYLIISSFQSNQFIMLTSLHDITFFNHQDLISLAKRTQSVSNHKCRPAFHQFLQTCLNQGF